MRNVYLLPVLWLMVAATPALALSDHPYLTPGAPDVLHLIPPPPEPGSVEQQRDVNAVLNLQKARSEAQAQRAEEDAQVSIFRFADVLGAKFTREKLPETTAFLAKVTGETGRNNNMLKDCYERPRPFVASSDVHPAGDMGRSVATLPGTTNTAPHDASAPCRPAEPTPAFSYSYPSGHSTFAVTTAIVLAEMIPEKREMLYARAWEYGRNRIVGGVHFPSDVEAGRIEATLLVGFMMSNPDFKNDFAAARAELRQALGLTSER